MEDLNVYKDESFDVVFVCHSFEHCMSPFSSLYEFKRILKDGGKLLLSTPLYCTEQVLYRDDDHYFVLTGEQLAKLLHTCRYKNINGWEELQPNKDIPNSSQIMYAEK